MIYNLVPSIGVYQLALKLNFRLFRSDLKADFKLIGLWAYRRSSGAVNQPIFGTKKTVILSTKKVGLKVAEKNFNINIIFSKTSFFTGFTSANFYAIFLTTFLYHFRYQKTSILTIPK